MSENLEPSIPLDINEIFKDLVKDLVSSTTTTIFKKSRSIFKGIGDDIRLKLEDSYQSYLSHIYEKHSKSKSFLIRDESTLLYDFYIPQGIECGNKISNEASIYNFTVKNRFAVIKGSAGSGKSMMMRYLFLNCIEKKEKIPIFIELRRINDFDGSLLDFVKHTLIENKFTLDSDFIEKALNAGHFAIFLDGFDEIATNNRQKLIKEIRNISDTYNQNIIIVSSRPDDEFSSWSNFDIWLIKPLTKTQATNLIKKVPSKYIDNDVRYKFLKDLEKSLFDKHKSFLSNPLLLSIMVITYANSGDVPQKISTFYESAYLALFEKHDALKGAFKRDRNCSLDILEFKKIFSAFSVITSSNLMSEVRSPYTSLRFPKTDALNYIDEAKKIGDVKADFSSEDFLQDCIKAICLLIEDGLEITYAHRSFQEYFTAVYLSNLDDAEVQQQLISSYFTLPSSDITNILYEINPTLIERLIIVPLIEKLEEQINYKKTVTLENYKKYLQYCFSNIEIEANDDVYNFYDEKNQKLERSKVTRLTLKPNSKEDPFLTVYAQIFLLTNYIFVGKPRPFTILSTKSRTAIRKIFSERKLPASAAFTAIKLTKDKDLTYILATDTNWGFSLNILQSIIDLKKQIVERHNQINQARKQSLLRSLRKK